MIIVTVGVPYPQSGHDISDEFLVLNAPLL